MELFREQAREVDVIITTALVPGTKAPILVPRDVVDAVEVEEVLVAVDEDRVLVRVVDLVVHDTLPAAVHHDAGSAHLVAPAEIVDAAVRGYIVAGDQALLAAAAEIASIIWMGKLVGVVPTLLLMLLGGVLGIRLIRSAGMSVAAALRSPAQSAAPLKGLGGQAAARTASGVLRFTVMPRPWLPL